MSKDRQKKGVNGFIILENNENRLKEHIMRSDLYKNIDTRCRKCRCPFSDFSTVFCILTVFLVFHL